MTEHKSHKVRIENIPEGKIICHVSNRSFDVKVFLLVIELMLLVSGSRIIAAILGFYSLVYLFSEEKKYYDGYDRYLVRYNNPNDEYCDLIYLSEIEGWEYRITNSGDKIILYLRENERYRLEENVSRKLYNYFTTMIPEREIRKKKEQ